MHVKNPYIWQYKFTQGCFLYFKSSLFDLCVTEFSDPQYMMYDHVKHGKVFKTVSTSWQVYTCSLVLLIVCLKTFYNKFNICKAHKESILDWKTELSLRDYLSTLFTHFYTDCQQTLLLSSSVINWLLKIIIKALK